jgi:hypothetical protein
MRSKTDAVLGGSGAWGLRKCSAARIQTPKKTLRGAQEI